MGMKNLFFNQGSANGKTGLAITSKQPMSTVEMLHSQFRIILEKGKKCDRGVCVCPKAKVLIREVGGYTSADVKQFCNEIGRYMKKEDGKVLVDSKTNRAIVRDEYKDCFSKCITEFLRTLVNRHTGAKYELPIAGWGVYNSLTVREGIEAKVTIANMGEIRRV